jgi:hypothetical protein
VSRRFFVLFFRQILVRRTKTILQIVWDFACFLSIVGTTWVLAGSAVAL